MGELRSGLLHRYPPAASLSRDCEAARPEHRKIRQADAALSSYGVSADLSKADVVTNVTVSTHIGAPAETVWRAVSDFGSLPDRDPDVLQVEFLTDEHTGTGTRLRETRKRGKSATMVTELEVAEWDPPSRMRTVADDHGTVWDTAFTIAAEGDGVRLTLSMDARAQALLPRLVNPLMKGMFRRGMGDYVDRIRRQCERD